MHEVIGGNFVQRFAKLSVLCGSVLSAFFETEKIISYE